jgi:hypothetical protein
MKTPNSEPQAIQFDISRILFEDARMRGLTENQELFEEMLGQEYITIGNVLLNAEDHLSANEVAERSGMAIEDTYHVCDELKMSMSSGPLKWSAVADHELGDLRNRIVFRESE